MYYYVSLKQLVGLVKKEIIASNNSFPILMNKDISALNSLSIGHLSISDLLELNKFIKNEHDSYKHPSYYTNALDSQKMHVVLKVSKWNKLLKIEHSDWTKWKENYHLLMSFNTEKRVEQLISITSSQFNEKVDFIELDLNSDSEIVKIDTVSSLNKAINIIYESLDDFPSKDKLVIIKSNLSLEDVKNKLSSAIEYNVEDTDIIKNNFYQKPLNLNDLKRVSLSFMGKTIIEEDDLTIDKRLSKNIKTPNLVEIFGIMKILKKEDLNNSDIVSSYLKYATSIVTSRLSESSLNSIQERSLSYFEQRGQFPLISLQDIDLNVLLNEQNIDLLLNYLEKKNDINSNGWSNFNITIMMFLIDFVDKNSHLLHQKATGIHSDMRFSFNFENANKFSNFLADMINYGQDKVMSILNHFLDLNKKTITVDERKICVDIMKLCLDLKFGRDLPLLKDMEDSLSFLSKIKTLTDDSEKLKAFSKVVLLYSNDDISKSNYAMEVIQKMYCFDYYFNETKPSRYIDLLKNNFYNMLKNYLNGSDEQKDNILFVLHDEVKINNSILQDNKLARKFIVILTELDNEMKDKPIVHLDRSYHNIKDLIVGVNDNSESGGREIVIVNAISYISQVEKYWAKRDREDNKYPSFVNNKAIPKQNLIKLYQEVLSSYKDERKGNYISKIAFSDLSFQSIFNLLDDNKNIELIKSFISFSTAKITSNRSLYLEMISHMEKVKNSPEILLEMLDKCNPGENGENTKDIINKITATWTPDDWHYVCSNLDSANYFRKTLADSLIFKNINFEVVPDSAFKDLFSKAVKEKDVFSKEQLSSTKVCKNLIEFCPIQNVIAILGKLELLKPENLLLIAKKVESNKENINVFKSISLELGDYIEVHDIKSNDIIENFTVLFNTMLIDEHASKNKVKNKLVKM